MYYHKRENARQVMAISSLWQPINTQEKAALIWIVIAIDQYAINYDGM